MLAHRMSQTGNDEPMLTTTIACRRWCVLKARSLGSNLRSFSPCSRCPFYGPGEQRRSVECKRKALSVVGAFLGSKRDVGVWNPGRLQTFVAVFIWIGLSTNCSVGLETIAAASAHDRRICTEISRNLVPLTISKVRYGHYEARDPAQDNYYRYHEILYSRFELQSQQGDYVLYSGRVKGAKDSLDLQARFSSWSYFCNASWLQNAPSDTVNDDRASVRRVGNAIAIMMGNTGYDQTFKPVQGPWLMKQKMTTLRIAKVDGQLFLVTTQPDTIVASVSAGQSSREPVAQSASVTPRFFKCDWRVGNSIDASTLRSQTSLLKAKFFRRNGICGY